MIEVKQMLEELGEGNEQTKTFLNSIKQWMARGLPLSEKQRAGVAKIHYKQFGQVRDQAPVVTGQLLPVLMDTSFRLFFDPRSFKSQSDAFQIYKVDENRILIKQVIGKGNRKSKKENEGKPGYHSLLIFTEYIMMNKGSFEGEVTLPSQVTDLGIIVDFTQIENFNHYQGMLT